jgi:hypothetical protein
LADAPAAEREEMRRVASILALTVLALALIAPSARANDRSVRAKIRNAFEQTTPALQALSSARTARALQRASTQLIGKADHFSHSLGNDRGSTALVERARGFCFRGFFRLAVAGRLYSMAADEMLDTQPPPPPVPVRDPRATLRHADSQYGKARAVLQRCIKLVS